MKNNKCPNCDSSEIITDLDLRGGDGHPPYIQISEQEPPNRPFIWKPKTERSLLTVSLCGSCGYTELHTTNYKTMIEAHKNGYKNS